MNQLLSPVKSIAFPIILIACATLVLELLASTILIYQYRIAHNYTALLGESSYSSLINIVRKAAAKLGLVKMSGQYEYSISVDPSPIYISDKELGYRMRPGTFLVTFSRKARAELNWERIQIKNTINDDASRWTGSRPSGQTTPSVYIFGDSFVFGAGVNDEQTFAYLLQQAMPERKIRLLAAGGYGLNQSVAWFKQIANQINQHDIVILGYADYYDERNVVAPSLLRAIQEWNRERSVESPTEFFLPRVAASRNGDIEFSYVQQNCQMNEIYCAQNDPPRSEMTNVSAALMNYVSRHCNAPVYLLHFEGSVANPVFSQLDQSIQRISALPGDFGYLIRDDVMGFDNHPGPYWHYAISRKLIEVLAGTGKGEINRR